MFDPAFLKSGDALPGGKYVLIQTLGRGAMGIVFRAKDRHLHRDVALKFLSDRARQYPEVKQRFLREARALAKIKNPHVVQVYEVSADDADELYIAMEYLVGSDLGARLLAGFRPSVAEGIELGLQACSALAAAHQQGVVHRDLKPSNLFLTHEGLLKIVDFGVSKLMDEPPITATGEALGTPYYMSPEQVRCEADIDRHTDIWSLGVIFYEMFCGARPFEGTTLGEVMSGILSDGPRTLDSRGARVPAALDALILRCLEKTRERRFRDIHELTRALRAVPAVIPWGEGATLPLVIGGPSAPPGADPPDQFAATLASEPSPLLHAEPAAERGRATKTSAGRGTYALGGALAGALLASAVVLAVSLMRREPATTVRALTPATAASVVSPRMLEPRSTAVDEAPRAQPLQEATTGGVMPPPPIPTRQQVRPAPPPLKPEAPASSAAELLPRASASAPNAASSADAANPDWLPAEPAGAAVSPYAEPRAD